MSGVSAGVCRVIISIGQGSKNPSARRVEVEDLAAFLRSVPPTDEAWFSGHLWTGDYRQTERWEATTLIVLDVDHHGSATDPKRRHTEPPVERRQTVEVAGLGAICSLWYHTPRGLRAVFELDEPITSPEALARVTKGAAARISRALREVCVHARTDKKGKPIDGYAPDVATFDRARLYYLPTAIVGGTPRAWAVMEG